MIFQRRPEFVNKQFGSGPRAHEPAELAGEGSRSAAESFQPEKMFQLTRTPVTVVTDRTRHIVETPFVNMVRRVRKHTLLEPGDTK